MKTINITFSKEDHARLLAEKQKFNLCWRDFILRLASKEEVEYQKEVQTI